VRGAVKPGIFSEDELEDGASIFDDAEWCAAVLAELAGSRPAERRGPTVTTVPVRPDVLAWAIARNAERGVLPGSLTHGDGSVAGYIGEKVVEEFRGAVRHDTGSYDLLDPELGRVDVKTKRQNYAPRPDYLVDVSERQIRLEPCDCYVFCVCLYSYETLWIQGYLPKPRFLEIARPMRAGEIVPSNGYAVKRDCRTVLQHELLTLFPTERSPE
jgi:hypothetical protein